MGPLSQLKRMFAETRLFATIAVFVRTSFIVDIKWLQLMYAGLE